MMKPLVSRLPRLAALAFSLPVLVGHAQLTVNVGTHDLLPNTAGQQIQISVSGSGAVQGMNFFAQVGDGFPDVPASVTDGPNITGVDIIGTISSTIFSGNNTGNNDLGSAPQLAAWGTTTSSGTVNPNGLLATLTIDTTGFSSGTFSLSLADTFAGTTTFLDINVQPIDATIINGFLNITPVPEPASIALVSGGLLVVAGCIRSRRRHHKPE